MPSALTTIRLAALCAICAAILGASSAVARARRQSGATANLRSATAAADSIEVVASNGETRAFARSGPTWSISAPLAAPADTSKVQALLDAIAESERIRRILSREIALRELSKQDFGLDNPRFSVTIGSPNGESLRIDFGASPPASSNEVFASIGGEDGVSVVGAAAVDFLSRPLEFFSDSHLCRVATRDISHISVERPGQEPMRLRRSQDSDGWKITSPIELRADWTEMQKFLESLATARTLSFLYGDQAPDADNAAEVIRVFTGQSPFPAVIAIGDELADGSRAALAEGGVPVAISAETAQALLVEPNSLRDRRVFASGPTIDVSSLSLSAGDTPLSLGRTAAGDWQLLSPVSAPADQEAVARLVSEILSLQATSFVPASASAEDAPPPLLVVAELHTPSATNVIRCSFPSPPPANSAETPTGTPDDTATIVVDDSPVAAVAPASALATLRAAAVAPALAISRSLGSFALRDILSIEVRRDDGSSQRFDFAPDGSMAIAGDDAGGEPISDAEEIASRIAAMADFLSAIQADAAAIPPKTDVLPPPPRITVEIEPRDPQAPHLTLMFRATNADAGTVSVTTSQGIDCPEYIFPAKIAEIFSRNFRESYHQPLRTSP